MGFFYQITEFKKNSVHAVRCDEFGERVNDEQIELGIFDAERSLPYTSQEVCYEFTINTIDNMASICGCSSISFPQKKDIVSIISDMLVTNTSGKIKTKRDDALKKVAAVHMSSPDASSVCYDIISKNFGSSHPDLAQEVSDKVKDAQQIFTNDPNKRNIENFLFCMGFHDKAVVSDALKIWSDVNQMNEWFKTIGYGKEGERAEDLKQLYAPFRKRDKAFIEHIRQISQRNPTEFFNIQTRPIAMRCLGRLNKDFFSSFCDTQINIPTNLDRTLTMEKQKEKNGMRILSIDGYPMSAEAVALCRTLVAMQKQGVLHFDNEMQVVTKMRGGGAIHDCQNPLNGRANKIVEVHVICSTERVCLKFDSTQHGNVELENLKYRFVNATTAIDKNIVSVFVRDAHTLSYGQLSHILWRIGGRAVFQKMILTTRFCYDTIFAGPIASFLQAMQRGGAQETCAYDFKVDDTILNLDTESLARYSGVCVVPKAKDACDTNGDGNFQTGVPIFSVQPPAFGRVTKRLSTTKLTVTLPMESKDILLHTHTERGKNVWKSTQTKNRGIVIPVSALNYQRKRVVFCNLSATVFIPLCFSSWDRAQLVHATKTFFHKVVVVDVTNYENIEVDLEPALRVLEAMKMSM